jgi:TonB family protein
MSLLCGEKADPKAHTGAGVTAAHFAARAGGVAALEFALDHGADRDARDRAGNTPLAYALLSNSLETARLLISRGAALDPHAASFMAQLDAVLRFDLADGLAPLVHTGWLPDHPFAGRWPVLQVAEIYEAKACLEVLRAVAPADQRVSFVSLEKKSALSEPPHLTRAPRPSDPRPEEEEAPPADVEVEVVVDQSGEVVFPRILSTPDPRLVPAAIEELNRLRFSPPKKEGQPVATRLRATLPFSNQHWEIYDSKAVDELPQLKKSVVPHYPEFLRRGGGSGTVELEFVVDTEGRVRDIMVMRTAHPAFAEAATDAIRQWVFTPGRMNGRAVNIRMAITIPFVLQN